MLSSVYECVGDGWLLQFPASNFYLPDGTELEGNPTVPDFIVENIWEIEIKNFDALLDRIK